MRSASTLCAALLAAMVSAVAPSARAAGIDGTGAVGTCLDVGKFTFKPPLTLGGPPGGEVKVQAKSPKGILGPCPGATGDGVRIVAAKAKSLPLPMAASDCSSLSSLSLIVTVKWKVARGTAPLNPSTVGLTLGTLDSDGLLNLAGDFTGTVTGGSFTGDSATAHIVFDQTLTDVLAACNTTGLSLRKLTWTGLKEPSTFTATDGSAATSTTATTNAVTTTSTSSTTSTTTFAACNTFNSPCGSCGGSGGYCSNDVADITQDCSSAPCYCLASDSCVPGGCSADSACPSGMKCMFIVFGGACCPSCP